MNMRGMSRVQRAKAGALLLGCALGALLVASPARAQDPTEVAARVGAYQDEPTTTVSLSEALHRAAGVDPDAVDEGLIRQHLYIPDMPDPELVIRTSGEQRTSNYLLWEAAYSEYVFTDVLWPDFDRNVFADCVAEFQSRDRRFGTAADAHLPRRY